MILASWTQFVIFLVSVATVLIFTVPSRVQMGSFFFESFQLERAFEYYSGALKSNGADLQNLKKLKEYYLVMGEPGRALELQESLVKLKPRNRGYHRDLISLYDWNRKPLQKLKAMEVASALEPEKERNRILFEVAEGYRWLRQYDDAERVFDALIASGDPEQLEAALSFYASIGRRQKVEELSQRVRPKSDPDVFRRWMAELAEADGALDEALQKYREILSTSQKSFHEERISEFSRSELLPKLGIIERINRILLRLEREEEAIALQRRLADIFPENLTLLYDLGYFHLSRNDRERARSTFVLIESKEKNLERLFDVCGVYSGLGDEAETNRCLRSVVKRSPENPRFLEALAESFIRLGEKREALRILEKILFLSGERDASLWRAQELILIAQNGPFDARTLKKKSSRKKKVLSEEKLDDLRQRVIYLREELGEGKRSEKLMLTLVRRHPKNKTYLKQLAFHYLDNSKRDLGVQTMERVLKLDSKDSDALRVVLARDAEEGRSEEVYRKLKLLEPLREIPLLDLRMSVLQTLGLRDELSAFCLEVSPRYPELRIRCEYEFGNRKLAAQELNDFILKEKRNDLRPLLASWYIELEDEKAARLELEAIEASGKSVTELRTLVEELRERRKARWEWILQGKITQVVQTGSQYLLSELDLLKKLNGPGVGVRLDSLHSANPFTLVSPYAYYGWKSAEVKLGPTLDLSDRILKTPFFFDASYFGSSQLFFNIHYENSRPEYALSDLQTSDRARRRYGSLYGSYRLPGHFIEGSLDRNEYEFEEQSGSDYQLYLEYLKTGVFHPRWSFGVRTFLADLSTDGERLRSLHIEKALGYYAVAQYANSFLIRRYQHWDYQFKLAVGGDAERDINFGEALNARAQFEYYKTDKKGLRIYGEYFKESYLARINDMTLFGLQFLINF